MVNRTFLSLILALLFSAMLVLFFDTSTRLQQANSATIAINKFKFKPTADNKNISNSDFQSIPSNSGSTPSKQSENQLGRELKKMAVGKFAVTQVQDYSEHELKKKSTIVIYGSVSNPNDLPVTGVVVKPDGKPNGTRTDLNGRYRLSLELIDNKFPTLVFLKSGYERKLTHILDADLKLKDRVNVNTLIEYSSQTTTVNGWIGEANGTGIKGEVVRLSSLPTNLYYSAISDASGNFTFEGIRRAIEYNVDISPSKKYKRTTLENLKVTAHDIPLLISLEPVKLLALQGAVVDRHGGSVADLEIEIRSETSSVYDTRVVTDNAGQFFLRQFPAGKVTFATKAPSFFKVSGVELTESSLTNLTLPIDMGPHLVSGWVRDNNGLPVKGARAMLDAEFYNNGLSSSSIRTFVTDETGYFEFKNLGAGDHYLSLYARGFINQGLSYDTSNRIDQLYLELARWADHLISSKSINNTISVTK